MTTIVIIWILLGVQVLLIFAALFYIVRLGLILVNWHKATLPYVPSSRRVKRMMMESEHVDEPDVIVDLGSGTGELLSIAADTFPNAALRGVEKRRALVALARLRFLLSSGTADIKRGDMFAHPIDDADLIVGFWITDLMPELLQKFEKEAKPGVVILSNMFSLPESELIEHIETIEEKGARVHVYRKQGQK